MFLLIYVNTALLFTAGFIQEADGLFSGLLRLLRQTAANHLNEMHEAGALAPWGTYLGNYSVLKAQFVEFSRASS